VKDGPVTSVPSPRTLLRGGVVHTPAHPRATALATEGDRVVWVGDEAGAASYTDHADTVVHLEGALVTPAFVDSHVHLAATGLAASGVELGGLRSREAALQRVASAARARPAVLIGAGWNETLWDDDPRPPTREELDRVADGVPVYLARVDVHSAVVSSALVDRAHGIAAADGWTPDGRVERDAHHAARAGADALVTPAMREDAIALALRQAAARGIGSVHEIGAPHLSMPEDFATLDRIAAREPVPTVMRYWGELGAYDLAHEIGARGLAGDLCVDGSIGSHTTALRAPYSDRDTLGHAYLDADQLRAHLVACTRRGLQAGFHVIGDRANDLVRQALRGAAEDVGEPALRAAGHRMEHVEMPDAQAVAALANLRVHASVQPAFDAAWGGADGLYARRLGVERALAMNPLRTMVDAGIELALGSDSPVTPLAPWEGVRAAVHHRTPGQRLSPAEAFTAHTVGGWRAAGVAGVGLLLPGAPATYTLWQVEGDLTHDRLPSTEVAAALPRTRRTVVAGRTIFTADGS
jgi:predicted amidohydrolase YtcJ